jgi:ABC-2 type transport system permease protein
VDVETELWLDSCSRRSALNQAGPVGHEKQSSIALAVAAPLIVMALVGFSLVDQKPVLNWVASGLRGVVVRFFTFLLTGVSFLRERAHGTLERLMTTTIACDDILVGHLLGFLLFATIQTAVILASPYMRFRLTTRGPLSRKARC